MVHLHKRVLLSCQKQWQNNPRLKNSPVIQAQNQCFESFHPNISSIYEFLEGVEELVLQNQMSLLNRAYLKPTNRPPVCSCCVWLPPMPFGLLGDRECGVVGYKHNTELWESQMAMSQMAMSRVRKVCSCLELAQNLLPSAGANHRSPLFWATAEYLKQVTAIVQYL